MENEITCSACCEEYTDKNPPRLLFTCGHTFCEHCLSTFIHTDDDGIFKVVCPEDGEENEMQNDKVTCFPKNLALVRMIESKKNNLSFKD